MLNANSYNFLPFLMPPPAKDENGMLLSKQQMEDKTAQINKGNNSPLIKQLLIGRVLHTTLARHNPDAFDRNRGLLDSNIQAPFIKQPLLKLYVDVKKELANPTTDANATMHNSVYNQKKTIIDTLMAQNKGKVIYVDFWATWCRPCIAAMPYSKKLEERYKGKNITFEFVCLYSSKTDWEVTVSNLQLTGNQYYCDNAKSQSITSGLKFLSFPHYVLINKNGEIITNSNGFRPNDPLTIKTIDKLLN
jgi:thiol-disulfide isomerase/thioredoxin